MDRVRRLILPSAAGLVATALLAACSSGGVGDDGASPGVADRAVEILVPSDRSGPALAAEMARIGEETGIDIAVTSAPAFTMNVQTRVMGNAAPDLVLFPQPYLVLDSRWDGSLVPLDGIVDVPAIAEAMLPGLAEVGRAADGTTLGLPVSLGVESLVWYLPAAFAEAGYEVPATHRELVDLTEEMVRDGHVPWCFGGEAERGEGGPATDWLEEYVLRIGGPEVYDQWVGHEIPFDSEVVVRAGEAVADLLLREGHVAGGRPTIPASVGEATATLLAEPPGCFLFKQGSSVVADWSGAGAPAGDLDWFLLPPVDGGWDGEPVLGTVRTVVAFVDDPDVRTVLSAMLSPEFGADWARGGEFLSPFAGFADDRDARLRDIAARTAQADVIRVDGSDQMPGEVGSGTFRTGLDEWFAGEADLAAVLAEIEGDWPEY